MKLAVAYLTKDEVPSIDHTHKQLIVIKHHDGV